MNFLHFRDIPSTPSKPSLDETDFRFSFPITDGEYTFIIVPFVYPLSFERINAPARSLSVRIIMPFSAYFLNSCCFFLSLKNEKPSSVMIGVATMASSLILSYFPSTTTGYSRLSFFIGVYLAKQQFKLCIRVS